MAAEDVGFVFECLGELRGAARYSMHDFERYLDGNALIDHRDFRLLVGVSNEGRIGMLTCNRFAMPRYIGFGYEIEEVVVHPRYRGRGFGKALVAAFLDWVAEDADVRRVIVKTDDEMQAGRIYSRYFDVVDVKVYSRAINHI